MPQARSVKASAEELLAEAAARPARFGEFYDRFELEVLRFFLRATRRAELAADLTAETFAAALESAAGFDSGRGSARAWLFGIARHQLSDAWQRGQVDDRARRRLQLEPLVLTDDALERIQELEVDRQQEALALLAQLPEEQRTAVQGRVIEEREYAELAGELAVSQSVVRQRVSRGLRTLRREVEGNR